MAITYSTNWMGPINFKWIEKHGDCWSIGRIDIRDSSKCGYDGWMDYGLAPMHKEDWGELTQWLAHQTTPEVWTFEELIETFEKKRLGRKIRWWRDESKDR